jgi:hypothetical protein
LRPRGRPGKLKATAEQSAATPVPSKPTIDDNPASDTSSSLRCFRKNDKSELTISEPRRHRDKVTLKCVASQPCLVCGRSPADAHHLRFHSAPLDGTQGQRRVHGTSVHNASKRSIAGRSTLLPSPHFTRLKSARRSSIEIVRDSQPAHGEFDGAVRQFAPPFDLAHVGGPSDTTTGRPLPWRASVPVEARRLPDITAGCPRPAMRSADPLGERTCRNSKQTTATDIYVRPNQSKSFGFQSRFRSVPPTWIDKAGPTNRNSSTDGTPETG